MSDGQGADIIPMSCRRGCAPKMKRTLGSQSLAFRCLRPRGFQKVQAQSYCKAALLSIDSRQSRHLQRVITKRSLPNKGVSSADAEASERSGSSKFRRHHRFTAIAVGFQSRAHTRVVLSDLGLQPVGIVPLAAHASAKRDHKRKPPESESVQC